MHDDLAIAQAATLRPILDVASDLGLAPDDLELYGAYKAKITYPALNRILNNATGRKGKIVLVTAITPTPAGEGKTTTTIGLAQALCKLGKRAICITREPSMGPVFGVKVRRGGWRARTGAAAYGGYQLFTLRETCTCHRRCAQPALPPCWITTCTRAIC